MHFVVLFLCGRVVAKLSGEERTGRAELLNGIAR